MNQSISLNAAQLHSLLEHSNSSDMPQGADLLELAELAGALLAVQPQFDDPRLALRYAQLVEDAADHATRAQIHAAHLIDATAVGTLTAQEFNAARSPDMDLAAAPERCSGRPTFRSPADALAVWLKLNYFDARDRIRSAAQLIAQFDHQHHPREPKFSRMAQRFADPKQHPGEIISAARRLQALEPPADEYTPICGATALDATGELIEDLIDQALDETEVTTRRSAVNAIFKRVRDESREEEPERHSGLFDRGSKAGLKSYELLLDALDAEYFASLLAQADNPRTDAGRDARQAQNNVVFGAFGRQETAADHPDFITDDEASTRWEDMGEGTAPSIAQRRLNALMGFLRINSQRLRHMIKQQGSGSSPAPLVQEELLVSTVEPQIIVTLTLAELEERASSFVITEHGHRLNATQLRQALARAKIIPMVLGGKGEVLDVGRSQRYHTNPMRLAIRIRDGGCIVPGCTMDPESCSIHHIWFWSQGGVTSVYYGAMLCETHHHDVHAGLITVIADGGVPKVILPPFVDPSGLPVRNTLNQRRAA